MATVLKIGQWREFSITGPEWNGAGLEQSVNKPNVLAVTYNANNVGRITAIGPGTGAFVTFSAPRTKPIDSEIFDVADYPQLQYNPGAIGGP
jgi:hypothetical protein